MRMRGERRGHALGEFRCCALERPPRCGDGISHRRHRIHTDHTAEQQRQKAEDKTREADAATKKAEAARVDAEEQKEIDKLEFGGVSDWKPFDKNKMDIKSYTRTLMVL